MTTKRIHEAATIEVDATGTKFRVCLISEGKGSSATFVREFFSTENAEALAGALSFPGHPEDMWAPERRDPLSAIGHIAEAVTIEEHDGLMGFWSEYNVAKSRPDVGVYLKEYASKLGLSIFIDSSGYPDPVTGIWVATELDGSDPYRSVDLVVAAGARGKFERVAEALRRITEASATAEEKEVIMDKDIEGRFDALSKVIETLVSTLNGKAAADLQVEADTSAVNKAVESRLTDYDKAVNLITEAKLTESQTASLRAMALKGDDVTAEVETAKQVLAEALASAEKTPKGDERKIAETHLGGGDKIVKSSGFAVAGFGKVN